MGVTVSGDGLPGPTQVPVTNSSESGGLRHRCPATTGARSRRPNQQGTLTFTGTPAGYGLYATRVPAVRLGRHSHRGLHRHRAAARSWPASGPATASTGHRPCSPTRPAPPSRCAWSSAPDGADASITSPQRRVTAPHPEARRAVPVHQSGFDKELTAPVSRLARGARWSTPRIPASGLQRGAAWYVTVTKAAERSWPSTCWKMHRPPGARVILAILAVLWRREVGPPQEGRARPDRRYSGVKGELARGPSSRAPGRWSDTFRFIIRDEAAADRPAGLPAAGILRSTRSSRAGTRRGQADDAGRRRAV